MPRSDQAQALSPSPNSRPTACIVLNDGQVEYVKGADGKPAVPETRVQYARDVTAFLMWAAEPHMEARKRIGFQVMLVLLVLSGLLYYTKKKIWSRLPEHAGH